MNFLDKLSLPMINQNKLTSLEYIEDSKNLSREELFKKYYSFMPKDILDNIDKIYEEYDKINNIKN